MKLRLRLQFFNQSAQPILVTSTAWILLYVVPLFLPNQKKELSTNVTSAQHFEWSQALQDWTVVNQIQADAEARSNEESECIWPEECPNTHNDRIINQLKLYQEVKGKVFNIFMPDSDTTSDTFHENLCLVKSCQMVAMPDEADALILPNADESNLGSLTTPRSKQIWIAYFLESPVNTFDMRFQRRGRGMSVFNWTASYRHDSDLVTPYSKFVLFSSKLQEVSTLLELAVIKRQTIGQDANNLRNRLNEDYSKASDAHKSLIRGKKGKAAWFASNCYAKNGRFEYTKELAKFIQVDIYGRCGNLSCPKWNQTGCSHMINRDYKFYLAFENSNCVEYITEKLYKNAFNYNDLNYLVLPIVMGAKRSDYERLAPPDSFIHVDDYNSPGDLASYLKRLDQDDALFYSYFRWKSFGRFIDTGLMCRVCALLHESYLTDKKRFYPDIKKWWNNKPDTEESEEFRASCYI